MPAAKDWSARSPQEAAFRQQLVLAALAGPLGLWLGHSGVERALPVGPVLLVLIVELLNSAIEAFVDRSGPQRQLRWPSLPRTCALLQCC